MGDRRDRWFHRNRRKRLSGSAGEDSRHAHDDATGIDGVCLADIRNGHTGVVTGYLGGEGMRRKAMELGLVPGAPVEVLMQGAGRLLVVRVGETRIMVGHGVARQVRVLEKE